MATLEQLYTHLRTLVSQWVYGKDEIDTKLDLKVDKVTGKGLSTNDYTTAEKTKLGNIEAEANKTLVDASLSNDSENPVQNKVVKGKFDTIETALGTKVTSTDLHTVATSGSYLDLENIPETFAPSTHEHSATEVKDPNAYTSIGTSANATQSAINYAINNKIDALLGTELIEVEDTLPTASAETKNKFYLVPESDAETNNAYEIYITVEDNSNYAWEKVDATHIDLTNYVTTNDSRLSDARTPLSHTHGDITNDGKIGNASGKILVTGTGGAITTSDMVSEMDATVQDLITYGASL